MKAVNRAYDVLSDPERRALYDATGVDQVGSDNVEQLVETLIDRNARQVLRDVFAVAMEVDSDRQLIARVGEHLAQAEAAALKSEHAARFRIKKLTGRRARITVAGEQENLIHVLIDVQLQGLEQQLDQLKRDQLVFAAAGKLLRDYSTTEPLYQEPSRRSSALSYEVLAAALSGRQL